MHLSSQQEDKDSEERSRFSNVQENDPYCTADYRKCVAAFVVDKKTGLIFSAERVNEPGAWQIPQGGVESSENDNQAILRELFEETGIRSVECLRSTKIRYNYDFPEKVLEKMHKRGRPQYKGQSVRFFLLNFCGDESEIDLATLPGSVEFLHWKWMSVGEIINRTVNFKKEAVRSASKELGLV